MKKALIGLSKDLILGIMAGMCISIGCVAFLSSGDKVVGSLFFVVGLFMILNLDFNLFTGKVCYALENKPFYILRLLFIWIGNFLGALVSALLIGVTRLKGLKEACEGIVNTKLNDSLVSLFVLAIFCNILIFLAVYGYKNFDNIIAKTLALIFGVSVFVLCGFEHCVADMFYFCFAGAWTGKMLLALLIITLGNIVGGLFIPLVIKLNKKMDNTTQNEEKK